MKKNRLIQCVVILLPLLFFSLWSFAQTSFVKGSVTDEKGESMPGVNIVVKGTTVGVVTDINGKFQIEAGAKATLSISFVGYKTQDIPVGGKKEINVKLEQNNLQVDEVVVVGYGVQRKSDVTGSVSSVKSEKIMSSSPTTIQQALQGKAAGVLITQNGTGVNTDPVIRISGNRSIGASNDPLFVIDGVPAFDGTNMVNPNDVQSVDILKDASATAIYGSRGANGVILITTKKGEKGKTIIEYNGDVSVSDLGRYRHQMNGEQYMEYERESSRKYIYDKVGGYTLDTANGYGYAVPNQAKDLALSWVQNPYVMESLKQAWSTGTYIPGNLRTFDWQNEGVRQYSKSQTHNISIRSGSENTQVFFAASFVNNTDYQLQSYNKRYTIRLNLDQKIGKRINVGTNINFSYRDWDSGQWMASYWNPLGTPWYSPGGDVTKAGDPAYGVIPQPCGDPLLFSNYMDLTGAKRQNLNNNLTASAFGSINIIKGLVYKATLGTVLNLNNYNNFYAKATSTMSNGTSNKASKQDQISRSWSFENNLSYNTKILDHSIGVTLVQTNEKSIYNTTTASVVGIPIESQLWNALGNATTQATASSYTQWQLQSYLGRATYSYKDRYLFTGSLRYDGSSRLAEGHKWVAFPSVALGWRATEESFLKGLKWLDNLKVRGGYGVTGNSSVNAYSTVGTITSARYNWATDVLAPGYLPNSMSNSALTWEKTAQYDAGIDFSVLKGRISGSIDLYIQKTSDLLLSRSLPTASGFGSIMGNVGATQNKGIEVGITTENIKRGKFSWSTTINWSMNKEEITKLNSGLQQDIGNSWFVGNPISTYYNYVAYPKVWGYSKADFDEMAKFNANGSTYAPGQLRLVDLNGDYKITDADRQIRGSRMPKWSGSISNTFTYGQFDLYIFMNGAVGNTIYWDPGNASDGKLNMPSYMVENYWTPTHTDARLLEPTLTNAPALINASYFWKGDYLKINDITVGYTVSPKLLKKAGIQKLRFSLKVLNPIMFTSFPGVDPEGAIAQTNVSTFSDAGYWQRTYKFGLNITF